MSTAVLGGVAIFGAMFVSGVTGFGMGLLSVPLLLLIGLPLSEIVAMNLCLVILTRIPIIWRLRSHLRPRRVAELVLGSVPGVVLGILVVGGIDAKILKAGAGIVVLAAAVYLALRPVETPPRELPGARFAAGVAGGFLGTTVSLNGLPPALLLSHEDAEATSFLSELAAYFVASSCLVLSALVAGGKVDVGAAAHYLLFWLPLALLGTLLGVRVAWRLPLRLFRRLVLALIACAGCVTLVTAV